MTAEPTPPYEAFFPSDGSSPAVAWVPPTKPDTDVYEQVIALASQLKEIAHPTDQARDEYADFFPEGA